MKKNVRAILIASIVAFMIPSATLAAAETSPATHEKVWTGSRSEFVHSAEYTSCKVFQYRVAYDLMRQEQNSQIARRLLKKPDLSPADIASVKRFTNRLRSRMPTYGHSDMKITANWIFKNMNRETELLLRKEFEQAPKLLRFADTEWRTNDMTFPTDVSLKINDEVGELSLSYITNGLDGCLGNPDILVIIQLSNGVILELSAPAH